MQELKKRSRIYGIKTIKTQFFNLIDGSQMKHRFDGVLVDAPALAGEPGEETLTQNGGLHPMK